MAEASLAARVQKITRSVRVTSADVAGTALLDTMVRLEAAFLDETEARIGEADKVLADLEKSITKLLAEDLPDGMSAATKAGLQSAIADIRDLRREAIGDYQDQIDRIAMDLARQRQRGIIEAVKVAGETVGASLTDRLTKDQLLSVARRDLLGDTAASWFKTSEIRHSQAIARNLRVAYVEGAGFSRINAMVRQVSQRNAVELKALARTVVQGVSNEAAHTLYDRNRDVLSGKQWIATLDDDTCPQCGPLDGRIWWYGKRNPSVSTMPRAPQHPNCRCFVLPFISGLSNPNVPRWSDWIMGQSSEVQNEVLGPGRAGLLRSGVVTPNDLRKRSGQIRTVAELRRMARAA